MSRSVHPLAWHGGKFYLAKHIIALLPEHIHYVEPYFGGGAVLFAKPHDLVDRHSEVANDINLELTNFWKVLQDEEMSKFLIARLRVTPVSQLEWSTAFSFHDESALPVERAVKLFIRYRQSRQGIGADFVTLSRNRTRRGRNEQVSSWTGAVDLLHEASKRLRRVVILCEEATRVITREDGKNTFFYCDPPYMPESRRKKTVYDNEMAIEDHAELLRVLSKVSGKFMLSGYHTELYDATAKKLGWLCYEMSSKLHSSSKSKKPSKTECLWVNYSPPNINGQSDFIAAV